MICGVFTFFLRSPWAPVKVVQLLVLGSLDARLSSGDHDPTMTYGHLLIITGYFWGTIFILYLYISHKYKYININIYIYHMYIHIPSMGL